MTTNDSKTGFLIYDTEALEIVYRDTHNWCFSIENCTLPFESVEKAVECIRLKYPWGLVNGQFIVIDLTGKQVWSKAVPATGRNEVEALRKQVANLTAEVARLKDQRRERIATAALQGLLACNERSGSFDWYATDAIAFADALIAKIDGKEN